MQINIYIYIIAMAVVTYLIRMLPLVLAHREIKNVFMRSFLHYVPFACLASMIFPAILSSTSFLLSAIVGFVVAIVLAYFERSMLTVALSACAAVFIVEQIVRWVA